jgi:hypothetical protein
MPSERTLDATEVNFLPSEWTLDATKVEFTLLLKWTLDAIEVDFVPHGADFVSCGEDLEMRL